MPTAPTSSTTPAPAAGPRRGRLGRPRPAGRRPRRREPPPEWRPPPKAPGFGFWMAVVWTLLYFVVTQVVAGMVFGVPHHRHRPGSGNPQERDGRPPAGQAERLDAKPGRHRRHPVRRRRHPVQRAGPELAPLPHGRRPVVEATDRPDPPAQPHPRRPRPDRDARAAGPCVRRRRPDPAVRPVPARHPQGDRDGHAGDGGD